MNKIRIRESIFSFNALMRGMLDKTPMTLTLFEHIILPVEAYFFQLGNYKISPSFKRELKQAQKRYYTEEEKRNKKKNKKLEMEILKTFLSHQFTVNEFFLYQLRGKGYWELSEYLSDLERKRMLDKVNNQAAYHELTDKGKLYNVAKQYFGREACIVSKENGMKSFEGFTSRHSHFIAKPIEGSTGHGATMLSVNSLSEMEAIYQSLTEKGIWIVEELIKQHPAMAQWNPSSVNTLRVPTFYTENGCRILQPFFRTGRKGAVIDNAGQGGIFAVFDPETGIITTDGVDEYGGRYECHPDSGIKYKGWKIPQYKEMVELAAKIIHELPSHPQYVGFDFALTPNGWVLVEGNYNGQFLGQMAELKGVRKQFIHYYSNK